MNLRTQCRAFMAVDMLFGIVIVTGVTIGLVKVTTKEHTAEQTLADSRAAVHLAEHVLLNLQHAQPAPIPTAWQSFQIQPARTGTAPAGYVWVRVDAQSGSQRQSLLGIVPSAAIAGKHS